jgi:hypothetical protein
MEEGGIRLNLLKAAVVSLVLHVETRYSRCIAYLDGLSQAICGLQSNMDGALSNEVHTSSCFQGDIRSLAFFTSDLSETLFLSYDQGITSLKRNWRTYQYLLRSTEKSLIQILNDIDGHIFDLRTSIITSKIFKRTFSSKMKAARILLEDMISVAQESAAKLHKGIMVSTSLLMNRLALSFSGTCGDEGLEGLIDESRRRMDKVLKTYI